MLDDASFFLCSLFKITTTKATFIKQMAKNASAKSKTFTANSAMNPQVAGARFKEFRLSTPNVGIIVNTLSVNSSIIKNFSFDVITFNIVMQ